MIYRLWGHVAPPTIANFHGGEEYEEMDTTSTNDLDSDSEMPPLVD